MRRYSNTDLMQLANDAILAADGRLSRMDAICIARAMFRHFDVPPDYAGRPK